MSCTKQHVSECMNHFRCWRLNKHIRFLGGCSTQTPPLSVCVIFKDRHVNCRGRIRLHIPDKSKLFFLAFTDGPFLADYGDVHHHYSDRHVNQSCSFSSRSVRTLPSAGPILSSTVAGCPAVFLPQTPNFSSVNSTSSRYTRPSNWDDLQPPLQWSMGKSSSKYSCSVYRQFICFSSSLT